MRYISLLLFIYLCIGISLSISSNLFNGKIWHITDTHYDFLYQTGGDATKQCREIPHKQENNSDDIVYSKKFYKNNNSNNQMKIHKANDTASAVGDYRCDTPYDLLISSFEAMVKIEPNPDFIIWTGDDPPHFQTYQLNQSLVLQSISNMTELIKYYFPDTRVFPSIGNHDSFPEHQIPIGPNWLFDAITEYWAPWLTNSSLETLNYGGYYSELVEPGFRIVSLNTVFYYNQNKQCLNLTDPAGQFSWLNSTLYQAKQNNEQVWIIGHVPPGYNEKYDIYNFHKQFNDIYLEAFSNYSDIIVAHFYGHEHSDAFRLYYDRPSMGENFPTGIMFLTPSLTPWQNPWVPAPPNNPSLRMYHYNFTDFTLLDYDQFWTNLTDNIRTNEINWLLEYRAREFFHVEALDHISMYEAYLLIEQVPQMLNTYKLYNSVSYPSKGCDDVCRRIQICSIRHPFVKGFKECLVSV